MHANARQLTTGIVGREPRDVGAQYWFDYLRSGRGLASLLGDDVNGAQWHMIKSGQLACSPGPLSQSCTDADSGAGRNDLHRLQDTRRPA